MPNTPEALAAWDHFAQLSEEARQAKKRADEAFEAIPRLSLDDIAELVRIKKTEQEGGDA
jgi:hypothetical protein